MEEAVSLGRGSGPTLAAASKTDAAATKHGRVMDAVIIVNRGRFAMTRFRKRGGTLRG
jgi:hypothetical protein